VNVGADSCILEYEGKLAMVSAYLKQVQRPRKEFKPKNSRVGAPPWKGSKITKFSNYLTYSLQVQNSIFYLASHPHHLKKTLIVLII
jgi:hypothetical protein